VAAAGFQIASAYVDVEARFSAAQVRTAVRNGLRAAAPGIRTTARTTIGRAIVDGIAQAFTANALRLEMALYRALIRLIPIARQGGQDIGQAITHGIISGLNTAQLRAALQLMVAQAGAGLSTTVDVNVREDRKSSATFLSRMKTLGKSAGITLAGALLTSAAAGLTQNAAILTTELVNLIGVVGLLPGAVLAAGVAFGTLKLAFLNMGSAISAGLEGDFKKMDELMSAMPPAAREATKALYGLVQALRTKIQTTFWTQVTGSIKDLGAIYVPMLTAAFNDTAVALGRAFNGIVELLNTQKLVDQWGNAFSYTVEVIDNIAEGLPNLVAALAPLFEKSSEMLANLTGGFDGLMGRFAEWANRVTSDGSFEEFVNKGLDAFGDLFTALKEIGALIMTVLGGISQGGGTVLEALGQWAGAMNDFFKTTAAGQGILQALGEGFTTIASILTDLVKAAGPGIKDLLKGLVVGLVALAPAATPVGEALGAIMTALAPLLPALGQALAAGLTTLATILKVVSPWIGMLAQFFSQLFMAIAPKLMPVIDRLGRELLPVVMDAAREVWAAMSPLIPVLADIAQQVIDELMPHLPALVDVFKQMVPRVAELAQRMGGALMDAMLAMAPLLPDLVDAGLDLVKAMLELYVAVFPLLTIMIPIVAKLIEWAAKSGYLEAVITVLTGVVKLQTKVFEGLKWAVEALVDAFVWIRVKITEIAGWIRDLITNWAQSIRDRFNTLVAAIKSAWNSGWEWIRARAQEFTNNIRTVINGFVEGVKNLFTGLWNAVRSGWSSGWTWLRDQATTWVDRIKNIVTGIRDHFSNIFASIPGYLKGSANGLIDFFNNIIGKVNIILPVKIGSIPRLKDGGLVGGKMQAFASGGHVHGPGGPREDKVPAMLSNGEFVINARSTREWLPLLEAINGRRLPDRKGLTEAVGKYANGGLVGTLKGAWNFFQDPAQWLKEQMGNWSPGGEGIGKGFLGGIKTKIVDGLINLFKTKINSIVAIGGGDSSNFGPGPGFPPWPSGPGASRGDSGVWRSIVALIRSTGPASGAFGNAYRHGDPLWHGSGRAVDWMGYNQDALASFLATKGPLELIHRTNSRDYAYTRGRNRGSFSQGLMQGHRNHIHIAMKDGGLAGRVMGGKVFDSGGPWPSGTIGINTSGRTEQVLTGQQIDKLSRGANTPSVVNHFSPGSIVLDASRIKDMATLVELLNNIQTTARQYGARPMGALA
jgi:phage-related protein